MYMTFCRGVSFETHGKEAAVDQEEDYGGESRMEGSQRFGRAVPRGSEAKSECFDGYGEKCAKGQGFEMAERTKRN